MESFSFSDVEIEEEIEDEVINIDDEPEELNAQVVLNGNKYDITYKRSFLAKLIQSKNKQKRYYSVIKNAFKSYGLTSSVGTNSNIFSYKRKPLGKIVISGEQLKLYLALNSVDIDTKSNVHDASSIQKYEKTPCLLAVTSQMGLKKALVLIDKMMKLEGIEKKSNYVWKNIASIYPNEKLENLIAKEIVTIKRRKLVEEDNQKEKVTTI